ncbi:DUF418 domain-containing protein [Zhihengliuella sp.]|uniref:DUF418 domain-containing protein n=1 Tax=Zhihengliuella sp. TaxID=1954483 RepID=UPI00281261AE|nr:DUF418 domain-containing protein [Zhihengliuella sp.]
MSHEAEDPATPRAGAPSAEPSGPPAEGHAPVDTTAMGRASEVPGPCGRATTLYRLVDLDALRAFALLGIFLVNVQTFADPASLLGTPSPTDAAGTAAHALVAGLLMGKFYILFSFLFGYSFALLWQATARRAAAAGRPDDFAAVALRRFAGLFVLGLAHGLLLFTGDILLTYALAGTLLLGLRYIGPRAARVTAAIIIGVVGAGMVAIAALMGLALSAPEFESMLQSELSATANLLAQPYAQFLIGIYPSTLASMVFVQGPVAFSAFLVGLSAAKDHWFERLTRRTLLRVLLVGAAVGLPGAAATAWAYVGLHPLVGSTAAFGVAALTGPFLTAAYVAALLLLFRSGPGRRVRNALVPAGQMALSNYLGQSVVMVAIYTDYGLDLANRVHPFAALGICGAVFAAQLVLSALWMRRFARGPVEGLLRALTYWQRPSWRRGAPEPEPVRG